MAHNCHIEYVRPLGMSDNMLLVKCETCGKPVDFSQAVTYRSGPYGYREELFMLCKNKECLLPFVSTEEDKKDIENILTTS